MTDSGELVTYRLETAGGDEAFAAYLTLSDPGRRNALSDTLLDQLTELLQRAASDSRVRVIVLTSSHERIFSSGGNLDAFADDRATIAKYAGLARFPTLFRTTHRYRQAGRLRGQRRRAGRCTGYRPGV